MPGRTSDEYDRTGNWRTTLTAWVNPLAWTRFIFGTLTNHLSVYGQFSNVGLFTVPVAGEGHGDNLDAVEK